MLKLIVATVLLFPWTFVALGVASYVRHRLVQRPTQPRPFRPDIYIQPTDGGPMLLDSAHIIRVLKRVQQ